MSQAEFFPHRGRPPIGQRAMTDAERQRRHRLQAKRRQLQPRGTQPTAITNAADAAIVKGMALRGDALHNIAAWFGINSGRIANVKNARAEGRKWRDVLPAPLEALPPAGPYSYFTPRPDASLAEQFQQAMAAQDLKWAQALAEVREELRVSANERRQTNEMIARLERHLVAFGRKIDLVEHPKAPRITRHRPLEA